MATNPPKGDGHRKGSIRNRDQVYNPKNNRWTKRNEEGNFMDQKADGKPFKGVRKINSKGGKSAGSPRKPNKRKK